MKVYDIALAVVRVLVVVDVIRELAGLISSAAVTALVFETMWSAPSTHEMAGDVVAKAVSLSWLWGPAFAIIVNLIILAAAPRIARFATKFAMPETAGKSALSP